MRYALALLSLLVSVLVGGAVGAESGGRPIVRVEVEPARVVVGQAVRLRVTVLVPTWFPKPVEYPSFELADVMTRLPPDSSFPTNDTVDGELWSGIVRDYALYPLAAAHYRLEGESIGVTFQDPEKAEPASSRVALPTAEFDAFVPAGAEALVPFLSGRSLELEEEIEGDVDALAPGSAIKRKVTARIDGMAAMFLPEMLHPAGLPGRSDYVGLPQVREDEEVGERVETITYVFERGGDFRTEPLRLAYWDLETDQIEIAELPALHFEVSGGGLLAPGAGGSVPWWRWGALLGSALVLGALGWWLRAAPAAIVAHVGRERDRIAASESHAFRRLTRSLSARASEPKAIARAFLAWDRHPDLSRAQSPPPALAALRSAAFGRAACDHLDAASRRELARELGRERKSRLAASRGAAGSALPPLNP